MNTVNEIHAMQRFVYQIALACFAFVGCAAYAQQAEQVPTEPTVTPVAAAPAEAEAVNFHE